MSTGNRQFHLCPSHVKGYTFEVQISKLCKPAATSNCERYPVIKSTCSMKRLYCKNSVFITDGIWVQEVPLYTNVINVLC